MSSIIEEKICKICFENENRTNPLIDPCECKGTGKWVHENCLKSWISQEFLSYTIKRCEICRYTYKIADSQTKNDLSAKIKKNPRFSSAVFFLCIFFLCSLCIFCTICAGAYENLNSNGSLLIGILVVMVPLQIFMLVVIFSLAKKIIRTVVNDFKIYPAHTNGSSITMLSDAK